MSWQDYDNYANIATPVHEPYSDPNPDPDAKPFTQAPEADDEPTPDT
jgi:hypothetical protein